MHRHSRATAVIVWGSLAAFVVIGLAGVITLAILAVRAPAKHGSSASNTPSATVQAPSPDRVLQDPLPELVNGIVGSYIGQTSGPLCEHVVDTNDMDKAPVEQCYTLHTVLYLVDADVTPVLRTVVANANANGWTDDGERLDADRLLSSMREYDQTDASQAWTPNQNALMAFSMITPNFFGEQSMLHKGSQAAVMGAFGADDGITNASDRMYAMKSEVPASDMFDFQSQVIDKLDADHSKAVVYISAGPKQ